MKTRTAALALFFSILPATMAVPVTAIAQDDATTTQAARARFKEGVKYYDKGEFEKARAAFMQAYALKKHPDILLNLAQSSLRAGHPLEAERYFQQFLHESKSMTPAKKADVDKGMAEARTKLGRLDVTAAPAGAEVTVDNESEGTGPFSDPIYVESGPHSVSYKASDGTTDSQIVQVAAGQQVAVKFKSQAAGPPAGAAAAAPTPTPTGDQPPPAPNQEKPPEPAAEKTTSSGGFFTPPKTMAPVYIGGVVALAGFGTAIAMVVFKGQAQQNANTDTSLILQNGGQQGTCVNPSNKFAAACNTLQSNINTVNDDARAGNIALGIGIGASVFTLAYWAFASKQAESTPPDSPGTSSSSLRAPKLVPSIGTHYSGFTLEQTF